MRGNPYRYLPECRYVRLYQEANRSVARPAPKRVIVEASGVSVPKAPSTYLRKSEYLTVGAEGKTTAFLHSNGAAFSLYTSTKASIACRS